MNDFEIREPMMDMFIFESNSLLEQLDEILLRAEKSKSFADEDINEIFRIMHTIKGSSAMMGFDNISGVSHKVEDLFFVIREDKSKAKDSDVIFDLVFKASDFMKMEIEKIQQGEAPDGDKTALVAELVAYYDVLSGKTKPVDSVSTTASLDDTDELIEESDEDVTTIRVFFEDGCQMENLRALMLISNIKDYCEKLTYIPTDIETNMASSEIIIENGFIVNFKSYSSKDDVLNIVSSALNVKDFEEIKKSESPTKEPSAKVALENLEAQNENISVGGGGVGLLTKPIQQEEPKVEEGIDHINNTIAQMKNTKQNLINVNLTKLDKLMDIVGEIVITESMVSASPDLKGLQLDNFHKSARQLRKLTDELQDIVMSIRMVPVSGIFTKMNRLVRDMAKKLGKDVDLVLSGEDTEVDKTIIDSLSDPLMHLIRNAMDHGVETIEDRRKAGKNTKGRINLSAQNSGGEVIIVVADDGKGMNPEAILAKAKAQGLLTKADNEYTEKEILNMVMLPGFSTKEAVTEFSGRGVGMDVVKKNIEKVGGIVAVESRMGSGTSFIIKIPLTLAIVDGMEIEVGGAAYTIPINILKESFKVQKGDTFEDTEGAEMIMIRGDCYPIIRLHEIFTLDNAITELEEGILILVESGEKSACLFVDRLIGEHQVVVKPLPKYLNKFNLKEKGISGCTILGDGSISLILDVQSILNAN